MEFSFSTTLDILGGVSPASHSTRRRNEAIAEMVHGLSDTIIRSIDGKYLTNFSRGPWHVRTDPKKRIATLTLKGHPDFPGYCLKRVDEILKSEELFRLVLDGNEELPVWAVEVRR